MPGPASLSGSPARARGRRARAESAGESGLRNLGEHGRLRLMVPGYSGGRSVGYHDDLASYSGTGVCRAKP